MWANGPVPNVRKVPVLNAPGWVSNELYDIEAKAESNVPLDQMSGPGLQRLLEDRFKLKVHSQTKEIPLYALNIGRGRIKVPRFKDGSCAPFDLNRVQQQIASGDTTTKFCGQTFEKKAGKLIIDANGMTMKQFCEGPLSARLIGR
jgi:uncharacterized protein (TIGR03435 family)